MNARSLYTFSIMLLVMISSIPGEGTVDRTFMYDASREKYYECTVETLNSVDDKTCSQLYLDVNYRGRIYSVYLCPSWYKRLNLSFRRGDGVKILGAKAASGGGRTLILARMVEKNGEKYWFRNYDGKPFWEIDYIPAGNKGGPPRGGGGPGGAGGGKGGMGGAGHGMNGF